VREESRREHNPIQVSSDEALRKAEQLAPLEERMKKSANQTANVEGVIDVDTGTLTLPKDLVGKDEEKWRFLGFDPLALTILIFSLAFIAFIAYLISIEPPPPTHDEPRPAAESHP
jgi:hypothetical protein